MVRVALEESMYLAVSPLRKTRERAAAFAGPILVLHDTTEFVYYRGSVERKRSEITV
jgi:hypothetical protein